MVPWVHPSLQPTGIPIGSAIFAELTSVTDRPTDRATDHATLSVIKLTIGCIYIPSTALRPNNGNQASIYGAVIMAWAVSPLLVATVHIHHRHLLRVPS